jgi:hypothetical protein
MKVTSPVLLLLFVSLAQSYITKHSAVPAKKQIQFLKKLTKEISESPTLSDEMIRAAPEVMKGWATSKQHSAENAVACENLLKRLVDESKAGNLKATPTTIDYNCMLDGWARSGEGVFAAERCEQILTQMQQRYEDGDSNVQPNLSSFKVVIMVWRESGESFSSYRAQRVLEWMIQLYRDGKNDMALPDSDCFDIVLQTWSRSTNKDAPRIAEKLLGVMEKLSQATESHRLRPTKLSFNAVLSAWGRSREPKAWRRLCDVLRFMEKLHYIEGNERVAPDAVTYNIVLGALGRSGDPNSAPKAESILRFVEQKYKTGQLSWKPDTIIFNSAMGCWAKSNKSGAFRKSRSILDRQLFLYNNGCEECHPDVFGFTSVLSACASESGDRTEKRKAFNVAVSTFTQIVQHADEFGSPNHVTYGTMLKACARLLPTGSPERKRWAKQLFEECASKGFVGDMVMSRLREASTSGEFRSMMQGHSKGHLPEEWTRNVHEKNEYRRKSFGSRKRAEV